MRNLVFLILLSTVVLPAKAQVTDDIVIKTVLGRDYFKLHKTLDSLGVWYYHHFHENKTASGQETKAKIYSIETNGSVKVYMIHLHPTAKYITEVVVNFRHDDKGQVEAMKKMPNPNGWHVGTFSTDMEYKWKSK